MTVSLSTSIAVPIANKSLRLTFDATTGNFVRVWCTAAPQGSKLRKKLDENKAARVHVFDCDSGKPTEFTLEAPGAYQLVATEFTKGAAPYGGGYQFAPNADQSETRIGETALTLYVATPLKSVLGIGADTAELVLYVLNDTIRETTYSLHGVATPVIQKPKSQKAGIASADASLAAVVNSLIGEPASTAIGSLGQLATYFIDKYNFHVASTGYHAAADADNSIPASFRNPTTEKSLRATVTLLLTSLASHIRNDSRIAVGGTGSVGTHVISFVRVVDWSSIPLIEGSSTMADHVRALADFWRAYESHRGSSVHLVPDPFNLAPLSKVLDAHRIFLASVASLNPTVPNTENAAKAVLVNGAGFEEI